MADRDKSHYPYETVLTIDGMTCSNCVRRVENALNNLDGVWAQVDLDSRKAIVRTKQVLSEDTLREVVQKAGYLVLSVQPGQSEAREEK